MTTAGTDVQGDVQVLEISRSRSSFVRQSTSPIPARSEGLRVRGAWRPTDVARCRVGGQSQSAPGVLSTSRAGAGVVATVRASGKHSTVARRLGSGKRTWRSWRTWRTRGVRPDKRASSGRGASCGASLARPLAGARHLPRRTALLRGRPEERNTTSSRQPRAGRGTSRSSRRLRTPPRRRSHRCRPGEMATRPRLGALRGRVATAALSPATAFRGGTGVPLRGGTGLPSRGGTGTPPRRHATAHRRRASCLCSWLLPQGAVDPGLGARKGNPRVAPVAREPVRTLQA